MHLFTRHICTSGRNPEQPRKSRKTSTIRAQVIVLITRQKPSEWWQTLGICPAFNGRSLQVTSSAVSLLSCFCLLVGWPVPTRSSGTPCVRLTAGSTRPPSSTRDSTQNNCQYARSVALVTRIRAQHRRFGPLVYCRYRGWLLKATLCSRSPTQLLCCE